MADTEVEETLREIRERVLASAPPAPLHAADARNGGDPLAARGDGAGEALARMDANLSTTARAWSRLPPVLTYRRGALARFELWLKRMVKRATHWFTWEQVNFNSAAHNALGDARAALDAHERALAALREELGRLRADAEARAAELGARVSALESRFDSGLAEVRRTLAEEQRVCFRQISLEASELAVAHDRARRAVEARLEALEQNRER